LKLTSFRRMRYFISERTAILIYKATILPILDYNDIIYSLITSQLETKLQRLQNRALRTVFRGRALSVAEMHGTAKVEYLADRRDKHLLALMFTRAQNCSYIDSTERVTRRAGATLLKVPKPKTTKLAKAPVYKGSTLWNALPAQTRNSETLLGFKHALAVSRLALTPEALRGEA